MRTPDPSGNVDKAAPQLDALARSMLPSIEKRGGTTATTETSGRPSNSTGSTLMPGVGAARPSSPSGAPLKPTASSSSASTSASNSSIFGMLSAAFKPNNPKPSTPATSSSSTKLRANDAALLDSNRQASQASQAHLGISTTAYRAKSQSSIAGSSRRPSLPTQHVSTLLIPQTLTPQPATAAITQATPNAIELYDYLNRPKEYPWKSPVVGDELFLLDLLYDGDEKQGSELLLYAKSRSSMLLGTSKSIDSDGSEQELATSMMQLAVTGDAAPLPGYSSSLGVLGMLRTANISIEVDVCSTASTQSALEHGDIGLEPIAHDHDIPSVKSSGSIKSSNTDMRSPIPTNLPAPRMAKKQLTKGTVDQGGVSPFKSMMKFNSCTTLFTVDNSLFQSQQPDPKRLGSVLKAVAHAIMSHVDRTYTLHKELSKFEASNGSRSVSRPSQRLSYRAMRSVDQLSEKLHTIWTVRQIPDEVLQRPHIMQPPSVTEVYTFLKQIFSAADLCPEVGIITLIYLERMLLKTHVALQGVNVFWAILGALMLASKVWDDQAVWNVDFKSIIPDIKLDDLNRLERWWLRQIGFDVTVKRTLYAKYWFGIREMTDRLNGVKLGRTEVQVNLKAKSDMHMNLVGVAPESRDGKYLSPQNKTKSTLVKVPSTAEDHDGDNDTLPSLPKPLTEKHMQKLSASSTYSQTKIRESFQELYDNVQTEEADCANEPRLTVNGGGRRGSQQTSNVSEFGWGSKLRRSKSDHLYEPVIPSASVL